MTLDAITRGIESLQHTFNNQAHKAQPPFQITDMGGEKTSYSGYDYAAEAAVLGEALACLEKNDREGAIKSLSAVSASLYRKTNWLESAVEKQGMFSDAKKGLTQEMELLKTCASELHYPLFHLKYEDERDTLARAATETAMLLKAAEALKENSDYYRVREITDLLILSARNQHRQEQVIGNMTSRIAALEEQLADQKPVPLDKKHYRPATPTA